MSITTELVDGNKKGSDRGPLVSVILTDDTDKRKSPHAIAFLSAAKLAAVGRGPADVLLAFEDAAHHVGTEDIKLLRELALVLLNPQALVDKSAKKLAYVS